MLKKNKIGVLITCFNRRELTIKCLERLFQFKFDFDVFLVDDNSSDGTSEAVKTKFPNVNVIAGTGDLFWNRGMHLAWEKAAMIGFDYYLWLNDDVLLFENSIDEMFYCLGLIGPNTIVSGVIESKKDKEVIYGGFDKYKRIINPNGEPRNLSFMNGNVVLISKIIFEKLGNLDPFYHHDLGDVDYGLRAKKLGINVVTTRFAIGQGEKGAQSRVRLNGATIVKRFNKLYSPLGSNPNITFYFKKKHFGFLNALSYYFFIVIINIIPDKVIKFIFGKKYN